MKSVLRFVRDFMRNLGLLIAGILCFYFGTVVVLTLVYRWIEPPLTSLMVLRSFQGVKVNPARPLSYEKIPSFAKRGIIFLEDHDFWEHHGIVLGAVREAWEENQALGRISRGGSTITQQLARNLFLFPDKLYIRKALEAGTALIMETLLPKERILELYLNHIEWGPGVFGIEAGARYQYGTSVRNLDKEQLSRLEAIIINPIALSVDTMGRSRAMTARYEALMNR